MNQLVTLPERTTSVLSAVDIRAQVNLIQQVMREIMKEGTHYGVIPGTQKPTLYKPGAEVLAATFRIRPEFDIVDLSTSDAYRYRVTCRGIHQATGIVLAEGLGSASSSEEKYKWRRAVCKAEFDETPVDRRRTKWAKGRNNTTYSVDQIRAEPEDIDNTVLKMACKRAQVAMTLNATAASDIFTQDVEDLPEGMRHTVDGGDEASADEDRRVHQPSSNGGGDTKTDAPASTPATAGMVAHIQRKLDAAKMDVGALAKATQIETLEGITVATGNALLKWLSDPSKPFAAAT